MKKEIKTKVIGQSGKYNYQCIFGKGLPPIDTEVIVSWEEPNPEHKCDKMPEHKRITYGNDSWSIMTVILNRTTAFSDNIYYCCYCGKKLNE